jgi:hypothetical protein
MSKDYLDSIHTFYSDRLNAGLKQKSAVCKGCSGKRQFIVKQGRLDYTCGQTSSSDKCGLQMTIDLAEYVYYPETIETHKIVTNMIDKSKHTDIYSAEEVKEYEDFMKISEGILKEAKKDFIKLNKVNERQTSIQKTHRDRMNKKKEQNLLMNRISEEDDHDKKHELMNELININQLLFDNYVKLHEECNTIDNFIISKPGSVKIHQTTYTGIVISEDLEKWKLLIRDVTPEEINISIRQTLESDRLNGIILNHFLKHDTLTKEIYEKIKGKYRSTWINIIKALQITGNKDIDSHNWLTSIQYHLNSSIIEKSDKNPTTIKISKPWKELLQQFKGKPSEDKPVGKDKKPLGKDKKPVGKDKKPLGKVIDKNLITELQGLVKQPKNDMTMNVIVAYRDPGDGSRKEQLKQFKEQMNLIFKDQTDIRIYIIEQETTREDYGALPEQIQQPNSEMAKFNLGILKNIGFSVASKLMKNKKDAYYVLSDVDMLPSMNLVNDYLQYPKHPIHLANKGTRYNRDGKDRNFLGGVLSINKEDFEKSNGYPNNFWGWGGEDNALNHRLRVNKIPVSKSQEPVIDLEKMSLPDKLAKLKQDQVKEMRKREKVDEDKTTWKGNGLSDLDKKYKVTKKLKLRNIIHMKVFLEV